MGISSGTPSAFRAMEHFELIRTGPKKRGRSGPGFRWSAGCGAHPVLHHQLAVSDFSLEGIGPCLAAIGKEAVCLDDSECRGGNER